MIDLSTLTTQMNPAALLTSPWLAVLVVWELFWKGLALWRAARHDQKYWFIALLAINTVGLLPIIYLGYYYYQRRHGVKWVGHF